MKDIDLRTAILDFRRKYGTTITFIANRCGVSREHLSRCISNSNYIISSDLKNSLRKIIKGEMLNDKN